MGNSVLQSGTSLGAFVTPLLLSVMLTPERGSWRIGFQVIGAIGLLWIVGWFSFVKANDLVCRRATTNSAMHQNSLPWWQQILSRRMLVLLVVLTMINVSWQILRAWLPLILDQEHGYTELFTLRFTSVWYLVTDVGCISSGALSLYLFSRGWSIKYSRTITLAICAAMLSCLALVPMLSSGPLLLGVFLIAGAGGLGMFPIYYSFSQDISQEHQGKVTGITGVIAWGLSSPTQSFFGYLADVTKSYNTGMVIVGTLPLLALLTLWIAWPNDSQKSENP